MRAPRLRRLLGDLGQELGGLDGVLPGGQAKLHLPTGRLTTSQSPEYAVALAPDCEHFMAMPIKVAVGYENLIFGEAMPGMGGTDGVVRTS